MLVLHLSSSFFLPPLQKEIWLDCNVRASASTVALRQGYLQVKLPIDTGRDIGIACQTLPPLALCASCFDHSACCVMPADLTQDEEDDFPTALELGKTKVIFRLRVFVTSPSHMMLAQLAFI